MKVKKSVKHISQVGKRDRDDKEYIKFLEEMLDMIGKAMPFIKPLIESHKEEGWEERKKNERGNEKKV